MTKLLTIADEARRALGRLPELRLQTLQASLIALCEGYWMETRGPEPATRLTKALWGIPPHLADLFVRLYAAADPRLGEVLCRKTPPQALAALVLAEIGRGDAEGARGAYEAMRLFESPAARAVYVRAILFAPAGQEPGAWLRHAHRPALWRAVVGLALQTGRWDTKAVLEGIRQIAQAQASLAGAADEPDMQRILDMLRELGVTFLGVEGDHLSYALRGKKREPICCRQLENMLAEGRDR